MSSKVAVDGFEPTILRWQAGMHPQDLREVVYSALYVLLLTVFVYMLVGSK